MLLIFKFDDDIFVLLIIDSVYVMFVSWDVYVVGIAGVELVSIRIYHIVASDEYPKTV